MRWILIALVAASAAWASNYKKVDNFKAPQTCNMWPSGTVNIIEYNYKGHTYLIFLYDIRDGGGISVVEVKP